MVENEDEDDDEQEGQEHTRTYECDIAAQETLN